MSYCYDVMSRVWGELRNKLDPEVRESEVAMRFEFLLQEMHEANHRAGDVINKDARVTKYARKLDNVARGITDEQD